MRVLILFFLLFIQFISIKHVKAEYNKNNFLKSIDITYENDSIYGQDRYYTNGIQISFLTTNFILNNTNKQFYNYSFGIGQKIFTSSDIKDEHPSQNDRPYAGYLYLYLNKNIFYNNFINSFGVSVGTTGFLSLAEHTQKTIHSLIGSPKPKGWHTQIDNELLLMLTYSNIRQIFYKNINNYNFNIILTSTFDVGTPKTDIKEYLEIRFGTNVFNNFISSRISNNTIGIVNTKEIDYYFFTSIGINTIFYNTFLHGNIDDRRKKIDINNFVYEFNCGASFVFKKFYLKHTTSIISKEFKTQKDPQTLFTLNGGILF